MYAYAWQGISFWHTYAYVINRNINHFVLLPSYGSKSRCLDVSCQPDLRVCDHHGGSTGIGKRCWAGEVQYCLAVRYSSVPMRYMTLLSLGLSSATCKTEGETALLEFIKK